MKTLRNLALVAAVIFAATLVHADAAPAAASKITYVNKTLGFSIDPPDFGPLGKTVLVPVVFSAPAKEGFAGNITMMIQPQKSNRKDFLQANLAQLKQGNATVNGTKEIMVSGLEGVSIDWETAMNGKKLHFLTAAVFAADRYYMITCTAAAEDFANQQAEFQKCINSLKVDAVK